METKSSILLKSLRNDNTVSSMRHAKATSLVCSLTAGVNSKKGPVRYGRTTIDPFIAWWQSLHERRSLLACVRASHLLVVTSSLLILSSDPSLTPIFRSSSQYRSDSAAWAHRVEQEWYEKPSIVCQVVPGGQQNCSTEEGTAITRHWSGFGKNIMALDFRMV